jgi:mannose-6-phosphate isomerase-like protein (cupin superfamily)
MQHTALQFEPGFQVRIGNVRCQSAEMTVAPRESEGGADNQHPDSDQWLYVVSGTGKAIVDGREQRLRKGSLLLIEHGEKHEIRCTGRSPLKTLNLYVPPAYNAAGGELAAGADLPAEQDHRDAEGAEGATTPAGQPSSGV